MKIVVVGGTGRIGSQVVSLLQARGHESVAAAPSTGVDALTGEGLTEVLKDADVVVDVANSPSFEKEAALDLSSRAMRNLTAAEREAGVRRGADATAAARPTGVTGPRRGGGSARRLRVPRRPRSSAARCPNSAGAGPARRHGAAGPACLR